MIVLAALPANVMFIGLSVALKLVLLPSTIRVPDDALSVAPEVPCKSEPTVMTNPLSVNVPAATFSTPLVVMLLPSVTEPVLLILSDSNVPPVIVAELPSNSTVDVPAPPKVPLFVQLP